MTEKVKTVIEFYFLLPELKSPILNLANTLPFTKESQSM